MVLVSCLRSLDLKMIGQGTLHGENIKDDASNKYNASITIFT